MKVPRRFMGIPVDLPEEKRLMIERLLARLDGVLQAAESKYVMLHARRDAVEKITRLLPGAEKPSLMNLEGDPDRVALHVVCREGGFLGAPRSAQSRRCIGHPGASR